MDGLARPTRKMITTLRWIYVWGPGLLVMLADTDAGNVVTAAQAGTQWGYRLLPLLLLLIPMLYMVQELTVRLGIYAECGHAELIRERFGVRWAWLSMAGLAAATIGSLVTEFTGVAGIGELYGLSRVVALAIGAAALLAVVATGSYRRVERIAIVIGLFELVFFAVAWAAHPNPAIMAKDALDLPLGNREFMYLAAAVIGAVFNPWMIFYQQSAIADKKLRPGDLNAARWDTAIGAVLTQCLTGAVLIAAAATLAPNGASTNIGTIGEISAALSPTSWGRLRALGVQRRSSRSLCGSGHRVFVSAGLGGRGGRRLPAFPGISSVRSEMVLWRVYGRRCRCCRPCLVRTKSCVAQYRGAGPECSPAAVGDRFSPGIGGENAAGASASAWVVSLDFDRHLRQRDCRGSIWRRLGTALVPTFLRR